MKIFFAKIKKALDLSEPEFIILILIIAVSIYFNFWHLEKIFYIGWDQERDAFVMWQILKEGKFTLIGPRAVGPGGFFLGPLWYYLNLPFYLIFNLDPIAAAAFAGTAGVLTTILLFLLAKKEFGTGVAFTGSLIWATYANRIPWNPVLMPLLTLGFIYLLFFVLRGKKKHIVWMFLLFGISLQIHFQSIFFIVPIAIGLIFHFTKNKMHIPAKEILLGFFIFAITFAPLVIFDLRHEFINAKSFLNFFHGTGNGLNISYSFEVFLKNIINSFPLPFEAHEEFYTLLLILSVTGIASGKISKASKAILLSLLLLPPIAFSFYGGALSEYYFALILVPMTFGLAIAINKIYSVSFAGKTMAILIVFLLVIQRLIGLQNIYTQRSLYFKKLAVRMIVEQQIDPVYNVSYSTPFNEDTGFRYLFKYYGREPRDIPEGHLWTIAIPANSESVPPLATFGDIGVIRR